MDYQKRTDLLSGRSVWIISIENNFQDARTLLISKVSEAIIPDCEGNHIGEGSSMNDFLQKQQGVRFIINGGFSHYRKNFYEWAHQSFHVGDPVGLVKIRHHFYEDIPDRDDYGFFVQRDKKRPWQIVTWQELDRTAKYILGCTPLLISEGHPLVLSAHKMKTMPKGTVTPPSILAHGLENHPRSAVGIKDDRIYFVVVEGDEMSGGCTLHELQEIGMTLGLTWFMNLDGGGSSQFRIRTEDGYIKNTVSPRDENRVLGHVIVLFEEQLKPV